MCLLGVITFDQEYITCFHLYFFMVDFLAVIELMAIDIVSVSTLANPGPYS